MITVHQRRRIRGFTRSARRKNYENLPPAYTFVGTAEPFLAETKTYIKNLQNAGIEAEIDIYPNMFHGFDHSIVLKKFFIGKIKMDYL